MDTVAILDRMEIDLRMRGRSPNTIDTYMRCVRGLVDFSGRSPADLDEDVLRAFVTHLLDERKLGPNALTCHIAALKFLYNVTLRRPEPTASLAYPKKPKRLPRILSHAEVVALIDSSETRRTRCMIMAGYGAGLRISEVRALQPCDIDSKRNVIIVRGGKGNKDRVAPLPELLLANLRDYWREARPEGPWLFPGTNPSRPLSKHAITNAFNRARFLAGLTRPIRFHSLRHAFATHLLEAGADILAIQALLGHANLSTSLAYLRVRADHLLDVGNPLDRLHRS